MLAIVMPVYNEQACVRKVVTEWFYEVEDWTEDFVFLAMNDGSTDGTLRILTRIQERLDTRLEIHTHSNRGHGQTCLQGYRLALSKGADFIFQIDSDGQCDPQYFFRFWREREKYDVIYGYRAHRDDGWRRALASWILRCTLLVTCGVWCVDANVPYRLMKASVIAPFIDRVPADFFLANIALAVLLKKHKHLKHGTIPIRFRERYGGEPVVRFETFGHRAWELVRQLRCLPKE